MKDFFLNFAYFIQGNSYILIIIGIWDLIWKGIALWISSQNKQRNWFVAILIFNTIGILPIVYLKFFQKKIKIK